MAPLAVEVELREVRCASSVAKVERVLRGIRGVDDVVVSLLLEKAMLTVDNDIVEVGAVGSALTAAGFPATVVHSAVVDADSVRK